MKRRYAIVLSRTIQYEPIEVDAESEEEAVEQVKEMAEKGTLYEDSVEEEVTDVDDLGEVEI